MEFCLLYHLFCLCNCHISTAKTEGIILKVKTTGRKAYGYKYEEFFNLKLYSLYDNICSYA